MDHTVGNTDQSHLLGDGRSGRAARRVSLHARSRAPCARHGRLDPTGAVGRGGCTPVQSTDPLPDRARPDRDRCDRRQPDAGDDGSRPSAGRGRRGHAGRLAVLQAGLRRIVPRGTVRAGIFVEFGAADHCARRVADRGVRGGIPDRQAARLDPAGAAVFGGLLLRDASARRVPRAHVARTRWPIARRRCPNSTPTWRTPTSSANPG